MLRELRTAVRLTRCVELVPKTPLPFGAVPNTPLALVSVDLVSPTTAASVPVVAEWRPKTPTPVLLSPYTPQPEPRCSPATPMPILAVATFSPSTAAESAPKPRVRQAVRVLYLGAGLLLLSYAGSRFVLEVILGRA